MKKFNCVKGMPLSSDVKEVLQGPELNNLERSLGLHG